MKRKIALLLFVLCSLATMAQDTLFKTTVQNEEYRVLLRINLYKDDVKIPGQDILGETYGYFKKITDSRVWIITGVELSEDGKSAILEIINDYGSEELTAQLTVKKDGTYVLKQLEGSVIKVAGKGKWIKIPKVLELKK